MRTTLLDFVFSSVGASTWPLLLLAGCGGGNATPDATSCAACSPDAAPSPSDAAKPPEERDGSSGSDGTGGSVFSPDAGLDASATTDAAVDANTASDFGPGNWPPAAWRPYASSSPFNSPVPAHPKLLGNSSQIVSRVVQDAPAGDPKYIMQTLFTPVPGGDCGHPMFFSAPSDPLYTVGACTYGSNLAGQMLRIPAAARPGQGCSDHHIAIFDQATDKEWDFYQFPTAGVSGGGMLPTVEGCGVQDYVSGSGLGSDVTAAHFAEMAGIIRGPELQGGLIDHALFVVTSCDSGPHTGVYPAHDNSYPCTNTANAPPLGARFWLDYTDAQIAALSIPAWEKTILTAMAHYGAYVGDQGGPNSTIWLSFEFESGETYAAYGAPQPIQQVAEAAGLSPGGNGAYFFVFAGVDWANHLKVVDPCVAQGTC